MNPEKKPDLIKLIEEMYRIKLEEAGIKPVYQQMEGTEFDCEKISIKQTALLSVDQLLDLYNDYRTLYHITEETKFLARAQYYKVHLSRRVERQVS